MTSKHIQLKINQKTKGRRDYQNGQFHDARDVISMSRTDVREMVDDDDDDEWLLVSCNIYINHIQTL